jgi:hypothetical protein
MSNAFDRAVALLCAAKPVPLAAVTNRKELNDARAVVRHCIEEYQKAKLAFSTAPRLLELLQEIARLERAGEEIISSLSHPGSLLVGEVRIGALAQASLEEVDAFIHRCRAYLTEPHGLPLIVAMARDARQRLTWVYGTGDPDKPDQGGQFSLYKEHNRSPRHQLFRLCAIAYASVHGVAAITPSGKGPFQDFLSAVWKAADEPKELSERDIRSELREIVPAIQTLPTEGGKPKMPSRTFANAKHLLSKAFAAGLAPDDQRDRRRSRPK